MALVPISSAYLLDKYRLAIAPEGDQPVAPSIDPVSYPVYRPPVTEPIPQDPAISTPPPDQYMGEGGTAFGSQPPLYIHPTFIPDVELTDTGACVRCIPLEDQYAPPPLDPIISKPIGDLGTIHLRPGEGSIMPVPGTEGCPPGFHRELYTPTNGVFTAIPRYRCIPDKPAVGEQPAQVTPPAPVKVLGVDVAAVPLWGWALAGVGLLLLFSRS